MPAFVPKPSFNVSGIDVPGALEDINRAAELDPSSPEIYFNRAHILQTTGRWTWGAIWWAQEVINGNVLRIPGQYEQADQDYSRVLELAPKDRKAYMRRGDA